MSILRPTRREIAKYAGGMRNFFMVRGISDEYSLINVPHGAYPIEAKDEDTHVLIVKPDSRNPEKLKMIYRRDEFAPSFAIKLTINPVIIMGIRLIVACNEKPLEEYFRTASDHLNNNLWISSPLPMRFQALDGELERLISKSSHQLEATA